jgi:hypothetical protein
MQAGFLIFGMRLFPDYLFPFHPKNMLATGAAGLDPGARYPRFVQEKSGVALLTSDNHS